MPAQGREIREEEEATFQSHSTFTKEE